MANTEPEGWVGRVVRIVWDLGDPQSSGEIPQLGESNSVGAQDRICCKGVEIGPSAEKRGKVGWLLLAIVKV